MNVTSLLEPPEAPDRPAPGPAILRLKLIEMMRREAAREDETGHRDAAAAALRRRMVASPSASIADVLAKLRTARMGGPRSGWADGLDLDLIESAIADLERLPAL